MRIHFTGFPLVFAIFIVGVIAPSTPGQLYVTDTQFPMLYEIDPVTVTTVSAVPLTLPGFTPMRANALATNPLTGTMYIVLNMSTVFGSNMMRYLATVDPLTGNCVLVGQLADAVSALTFDGNGILFAVVGDGGVAAEELFTVDLSTGAMTSLTPLGLGDSGESIGFNCDDNLIYHYSGWTTPLAEVIDPSTLTTSSFATTIPSLIEFQGVVWEGPGTGTFLSNSFGELGRIDTAGNYTMLGFMMYPGGGIMFGGGIAFGGASFPGCSPPAPSCALSMTGTINPDASYGIAIDNSGCTPLTPYFTCITINAGVAPAGYFAGISPFLGELNAQLNALAPPFNGTLDAAGGSSFGALLPTGPLGITVDAVTVEHLGGLVLGATPAITSTL